MKRNKSKITATANEVINHLKSGVEAVVILGDITYFLNVITVLYKEELIIEEITDGKGKALDLEYSYNGIEEYITGVTKRPDKCKAHRIKLKNYKLNE